MTFPTVDGVEVAPKDHAHGEYGGTAAELTAVNPILHEKQIGFETDTGSMKIGDGTTAWNDLAYWLPPYAAPLASPAFTGTPTAPTQAAGDDSTLLATTAFVAAAADLLIPATEGIVHDAGVELLTIRGAIRNQGDQSDGYNYWTPIIDTNHQADVGVASVLTGTASVNINFTRSVGKRVSCAVTSDETLVAKGFRVGASFSETMLQLTFSCHRLITDELTWNGSAWVWSQGGRFSDFFSATLAASSAIGATSISSNVSIAEGQTIQIDTDGNAETVTTTGGPSGTGPYTIPVPALVKAHSSGVAVVGSTDSGGLITLRHAQLKGRGMSVLPRAGSGSPAARYLPMIAADGGSTSSTNSFAFAFYDRTSVQWVQVGTLQAGASIGATSISSNVSIAAGTQIRIDTGTSIETMTTTGGPSGTGPYTIPVPALVKAHSSGAAIYTTKIVDSVVTSRAAGDANNLRCLVSRVWEGAVNPQTDITDVAFPLHNVWFEATAHYVADDGA